VYYKNLWNTVKGLRMEMARTTILEPTRQDWKFHEHDSHRHTRNDRKRQDYCNEITRYIGMLTGLRHSQAISSHY